MRSPTGNSRPIYVRIQLFTATVSPQSGGGIPTGKVTFLNGATVLASAGLSKGVARYSAANLAIGSDAITAVYNGDANYTSSTSSPVDQVVLATTSTTLTSSPNPSTYGQSVVFTATVSSSAGTPLDGDTVTFKIGTTVLGTATLSGGMANFSTSTLEAGSKAVTAVYEGDATFAGNTSKPLTHVTHKASSMTTLGSSQNPSTFGQSVTFTATVGPQVSGTPTGAVVFKDGSTVLISVPLIGGSASYTTSTLAIKAHHIVGSYTGSADFTPSTGSLTQTVN